MWNYQPTTLRRTPDGDKSQTTTKKKSRARRSRSAFGREVIKSVDPVFSSRRWARFVGYFGGDFWRSGMVGPKLHSSGGGWLIDYGGVGEDARDPGFLWGSRIIDDPSASRWFFVLIFVHQFILCSLVKLFFFSSIWTFVRLFPTTLTHSFPEFTLALPFSFCLSIILIKSKNICTTI